MVGGELAGEGFGGTDGMGNGVMIALLMVVGRALWYKNGLHDRRISVHLDKKGDLAGGIRYFKTRRNGDNDTKIGFVIME